MVKINRYHLVAAALIAGLPAITVAGCAKNTVSKSAIVQEKASVDGGSAPADQQAKIQAMMDANKARAQQGAAGAKAPADAAVKH